MVLKSVKPIMIKNEPNKIQPPTPPTSTFNLKLYLRVTISLMFIIKFDRKKVRI